MDHDSFVGRGMERSTDRTVFICDATPDSRVVRDALVAAGYAVLDVALSNLVARADIERPRVILIDADADGALDYVAQLRDSLLDADDIHVLFASNPDGVLASADDARHHEGSGMYVRPIDVPALVWQVGNLLGLPPGTASPAGRTLPPSTTRTSPHVTRLTDAPPSLPPPSMRSAASFGPGQDKAVTSRVPTLSESSAHATLAQTRRFSPAEVSPELRALLAAAEEGMQDPGEYLSATPSPEEEIESVLPAELLAALDEPIEEDDAEDELVGWPRAEGASQSPERASSTGSREIGGPIDEGRASRSHSSSPDEGRASRSHSRSPDEGGASRSHSSSPDEGGASRSHSRSASDGTSQVDPPLDVSTHRSSLGTNPPPAPDETTEVPALSLQADIDPGPTLPPTDNLDVFGPTRSRELFPPAVQREAIVSVVAQAIAYRATGAMAFARTDGVRRITFREGDFVAATSTSPDESLVAFLGIRGDVPRETLRRLGNRFPACGRHAGAALVARGYLRQDQMWLTLRAHAEWLLGRVLELPDARLSVESELDAKSSGEPSVFGGSSGASVFVDVVRRVISPADAVTRLGGPDARVDAGDAPGLLEECALDSSDLDLVRASVGRSLDDALGKAPEAGIAAILLALVHMGVVTIHAAANANVASSTSDDEALDDHALRERIRARLQLVEEGDYFAVLGVPRNATGYEIRRAFLELRRAFEPSRVSTSTLADLYDDLRTIVAVLEEAYDILKDSAQRERYRRAIEMPGG